MGWICGENDDYVRTDAITAFEIREWPEDAWTIVVHYGERREATLKTMRQSGECVVDDARRLVGNLLLWMPPSGPFDIISYKDYDPIRAREQ